MNINISLDLDFLLLIEQKNALTALLNDEKTREVAEGLWSLIDHIQDKACSMLGSEVVYGPRYARLWVIATLGMSGQARALEIQDDLIESDTHSLLATSEIVGNNLDIAAYGTVSDVLDYVKKNNLMYYVIDLNSEEDSAAVEEAGCTPEIESEVNLKEIYLKLFKQRKF